MIPRPHANLEPRPVWLKTATAAVAFTLERTPGTTLADARLVIQLLGMAEVDELEVPTISADAESGWFLAWSRGSRSFVVQVHQGAVVFRRYWDGKPQPIAPVHIQGGHAVQFRELICWAFGYTTYTSNGFGLLTEAQQGGLAA